MQSVEALDIEAESGGLISNRAGSSKGIFAGRNRSGNFCGNRRSPGERGDASSVRWLPAGVGSAGRKGHKCWPASFVGMWRGTCPGIGGVDPASWWSTRTESRSWKSHILVSPDQRLRASRLLRAVDRSDSRWRVAGPDRLSPSERTLRSRHAAHTLHSRLTDPAAHTGPARRAFLDRFERQVDPQKALEPAERGRRAAHARKAYFTALALKSAKARRLRRGGE